MLEKHKINADEFVAKFMEEGLEHLLHIQSAIKIFSLTDIAPYLRMPIPPIFLGYNLLIHITEGYFRHQIESTSYMVQAPAVLISNYGHMSAIDSVDKSAQGYCVLIKEQAMISLFREKEILNIFTITPLLNLSEEESLDLYSLLALLHKEVYSNHPYIEYCESIFKTVILKIIKLSGVNKSLSRKHQIAITFKQLIHKHFIKQKSLDFYADLMAVSINYLNRCVTAVYKKSAKQLLLEVLIVHSQLLLAETNKTVANIAYELEFEDPSYFTRLFRKMVGTSPSSYRLDIQRK